MAILCDVSVHACGVGAWWASGLTSHGSKPLQRVCGRRSVRGQNLLSALSPARPGRNELKFPPGELIPLVPQAT